MLERPAATPENRRDAPANACRSGMWTLTRRQQPLPEDARGLLELGAPHDLVRRRDRRELFGVPHRVAGAADESGGLGIERLEQSDGAGKATRHGFNRCVDDNLDVILPSDGEVLLENGDRVEVSGWAEGGVEQLPLRGPGRSGMPVGRRR